MYDDGLGVARDYVQAHMWFNLAATQGHEKAQKARDAVAQRMTPTDVSKAQKLARDLWRKHQKPN